MDRIIRVDAGVELDGGEPAKDGEPVDEPDGSIPDASVELAEPGQDSAEATATDVAVDGPDVPAGDAPAYCSRSAPVTPAIVAGSNSRSSGG